MIPFKTIFLNLFSIAFVVVFPHLGLIPLPFGYVIPVLFFIGLFLFLQGEKISAIGFSFKEISLKSFVTGSIAAGFLFCFLQYAFFPILEKLVQLPPVNLGDIAHIKGNTGFYIFLIAMGWLVGGLYEEIVFHGFVFNSMKKIIPGKYALTVAFVICNSIFAAYHFQLGLVGVINAFVAGSVYQALMLHYKGNMWYAIFCHAIYDTIALTAIYVGY